MAVPATKLPLTGVKDGDQIIDAHGNIYEFNTEQKTWVFLGQIQEPPIVTEQNDGLVSPPIFDKLTLIQKLKDRGISFDPFKLATEAETPYFYFFYSV